MFQHTSPYIPAKWGLFDMVSDIWLSKILSIKLMGRLEPPLGGIVEGFY